jgi:hypothetical protein
MTVYTYDQSRGWFWGSGTTTVDSKVSQDPYARYYPYFMGWSWLNPGWNFVLVRMGNDSYQAGTCDANLAVDYAYIAN